MRSFREIESTSLRIWGQEFESLGARHPGMVLSGHMSYAIAAKIGRLIGVTVTLPVDHANRRLFHRDIQSGKVFHGYPPLALRARMRPRISTVTCGTAAVPAALFAAISGASRVTRALARSADCAPPVLRCASPNRDRTKKAKHPDSRLRAVAESDGGSPSSGPALQFPSTVDVMNEA